MSRSSQRGRLLGSSTSQERVWRAERELPRRSRLAGTALRGKIERWRHAAPRDEWLAQSRND